MTPNANLTSVTIEDLKSEFSASYTNFAIQKNRYTANTANLVLHSDELITITQKMITTTNTRIALFEQFDGRLKQHAQYKTEGASLQLSNNGQLIRGKQYLAELKLKLSTAQNLASLFALSTDNLVAEAKKNKASAELISKTPDLLAKIPTSEIPLMTHQDPELTAALTQAVLKQEYTTETATTYAALDTGSTSDAEKAMIAKAENESISKLLSKMNEHLEKKIAEAMNRKSSPWALGYFGSGYKLTKDDKEIAVPQGIYDIKNHLTQIGTVPAKQILKNIQQLIATKLVENKDESILARFTRFVSWIFGCGRSQETVKEYGDLNRMCLRSDATTPAP